MRTAQPQKPPSRTAEAQRSYRRRNTLSSGPDADARRSRETALHCTRQAQVHARPSALQYHPTTDLGPDEIVGRDHGLDPHRLRQTEYRACLAFTPTACLAYSIAPSQRPYAGRRSPRKCPSQSLPFFAPFSYRSRQVAPLPCKPSAPASHTARDRVIVRLGRFLLG